MDNQQTASQERRGLDHRTQFDYLLNGLEFAAHADDPAKAGYAEKRRALFAYVRDLEVRAAPVQAVRLSEEQRAVLAFLHGEAPLDGAWFGDQRPTERGAFWWRKHLRAAFPPPPAGTAGGGGL